MLVLEFAFNVLRVTLLRWKRLFSFFFKEKSRAHGGVGVCLEMHHLATIVVPLKCEVVHVCFICHRIVATVSANYLFLSIRGWPAALFSAAVSHAAFSAIPLSLLSALMQARPYFACQAFRMRNLRPRNFTDDHWRRHVCFQRYFCPCCQGARRFAIHAFDAIRSSFPQTWRVCIRKRALLFFIFLFFLVSFRNVRCFRNIIVSLR